MRFDTPVGATGPGPATCSSTTPGLPLLDHGTLRIGGTGLANVSKFFLSKLGKSYILVLLEGEVMDEAQLKAFTEGPVPDDSQCRGVALRDLRPGECAHQMGYGGPGESTYCGAPKVEGFSLCEFHLFDALVTFDAPVDHLRE